MSQLERSVCPSILMRWNRYGKNVNFASEGAVLILDEKNQIVQGQASELSKKADQLFFRHWKEEFEYQMQKKKYQVVYRVSDTTNGK